MKLDMTTQQGYDIACALRGPDELYTVPSRTECLLKRVFTARIRALAGSMPLCSSTRRTPISMADATSLLALEAGSIRHMRHFLIHIQFAAGALDDEGLAKLTSLLMANQLDTLTNEEIITAAGG